MVDRFLVGNWNFDYVWLLVITLHIVEIFVSKVPNFLVEFMWYDLWILHCVMIMIYVPCWFNLFSNMLIWNSKSFFYSHLFTSMLVFQLHIIWVCSLSKWVSELSMQYVTWFFVLGLSHLDRIGYSDLILI